MLPVQFLLGIDSGANNPELRMLACVGEDAHTTAAEKAALLDSL
jgi:hypothetical protein